MIPNFPDFSKATIHHGDFIRDFCTDYQPYSDFNFTSLYCWDTTDTAEFSMLNNNLVIKIPDYTTGEDVYSILGKNMLEESIEILLTRHRALELVPEKVIENIDSNRFNIKDDIDSYDYVYSIASLAEMNGGAYKNKRKQISRFLEKSPDANVQEFNNSININHTIRSLLYGWAESKNIDDKNSPELLAIEKMLTSFNDLPLYGFLLFDGEKAIGFSILENVNSEYVTCHFQKTLPDYMYSDTYFSREIAKRLIDSKRTYLNWEQDLGIPGLRQMKQSYKPVSYLKKFTVTR